MARPIEAMPLVAAAALALLVGACGHNPFTTASRPLSERECMARAMYFESNRSSEDGMAAVGTVVMNRLDSGRYPGSVCGVVGQRNQFADGVLSKPVSGRSWALALAKADAVLAGERHARVGTAMHFHTAGYTFPYRNMAYVVAAGGNVFYDKKTPGTFTPVHPNVLVAEAQGGLRRPSEAIVVARVEAARPVAAREDRVRLAQLDAPVPTRIAPALARAGSAAAPSRRAEPPHRAEAPRHADAPRARPPAERIRLAHLEDDMLPRALRLRSDAGSQPRIPALPPPSKPEPASRTKGAPVATHPTPTAAAPKPSAMHAAPSPRGGSPGVLLPYRDAKAAKPPAGGVKAAGASAADAAAKAGWKRGPEPAGLALDKDRSKRRP